MRFFQGGSKIVAKLLGPLQCLYFEALEIFALGVGFHVEGDAEDVTLMGTESGIGFL